MAPEMPGVISQPPFLLVSLEGASLAIDFELESDSGSGSADELTFARNVHINSGDWYTVVDCDWIEDDDRGRGDEVVYLGDEDKLSVMNDESVSEIAFINLAYYDRFSFIDHNNKFYANFEPECREKLGVDSTANHIAFFNKEAP